VLDIRYLTSKTGPHDVRWEKIERLRPILIGGTYSVSPKQLAAKLLERMLERDRANHRWKCNRSGTTNNNFGLSELLLQARVKRPI
jgi:Anti-sigma-28 factor, FlgM